jgi:AraC-like DNA-binding protein
MGAEHGRIPAVGFVAEYVEHYWWARWQLDEAADTEVLSYPSVHVTFERGEARIVGVVRERFVRTLEGRGEVFGIKFRPGMFRPLTALPVSALTDRTVPLCAELGTPDLAGAVLACSAVEARTRLVQRRLEQCLPKPDPKALVARDLVDRVRNDRELRSVVALARWSGMTERALQRLFREFVGVSPKWVVRRFRLQEAAEQLAKGTETVAAIAAELGYFDQAHFVRDFRAVVGETPSGYARASARAR